MTRVLLAVVACVAFAPLSMAVDAATAPDKLVKATVDDVLAAIKQTNDKRTLRELAEQKVLPHFDFAQMTQLAVGKAWRDASADQQQLLVDGFRALLVNSYITTLTFAAKGAHTIEVKPGQLQARQSDATVRTLLSEPGKQPIAIDYRLARTPGGWTVYDVAVENLSLVTNYRGSFAGEISRAGIDGLIRALDTKSRALARG